MKTISILTYSVALCLPIAAIAQERVKINGTLSDGTPPPPSPPRVLPEFKIISSGDVSLGQRKMVVQRVKNPGFPDPTPPAPAEVNPATIAAFKKTPAYLEWQKRQAQTTSLFLSASVVDKRATLLRWWEGGKEYKAWSNVDFKHLTGFGSFSKGEHNYVLFMAAGDVPSASPRNKSYFHIPAELPVGAPDFRMVQGGAGESEGYATIVALHELYASDGVRLRQAYELREARRKAAEAELRANPPIPKDIVLNFWKVEQPKKVAKAQATQLNDGKVEGRVTR